LNFFPSETHQIVNKSAKALPQNLLRTANVRVRRQVRLEYPVGNHVDKARIVFQLLWPLSLVSFGFTVQNLRYDTLHRIGTDDVLKRRPGMHLRRGSKKHC
jgi:hypothetical protein